MQQAIRIVVTVLTGATLALVPVVSMVTSASAATVPVVHGMMPGGAAIYNAAARGTSHRGTAHQATGHRDSAQGAPLRSDTVESSNWSGYAQSESAATSAGGSWTVPSVAASTSPEYSASWVGIDGYDDSQLIQTGTAQDTEDGQTYYYAWWEVLPAAETQITALAVTPGDQMTATIDQVATGEWQITLDDLTTDQTWSQTTAYDGPGHSAEWIEEAPTVNNDQSSLADFGTVAFTDATVDGSTPDLLASQAVDMVDTANDEVIATPSAPDSTADGFAVAYGSVAPAAPTSPSPTTPPSTAQPSVSVPGAPTDVHASVEGRDATVTWGAPGSDGGAPVTSYTVELYVDGTETRQIVTGTDATTLSVAGLAGGEHDAFTVAATNTAGSGNASAASNVVIPATNTTPSAEMLDGQTLPSGARLLSANKKFEVIMQRDGNLVEYTTGGRVLWSSHTSGHPGARAVMQGDGNLVVYSGTTALWSTATGGRGASHAVVQDDANFVVYNAKGQATWASGINAAA